MDMKNVEVADSLDALLNEESNKEPTQNDQPTNSNVIVCPPPIDTIKITRLALEKMFILAQEIFHVFDTPLEAYCLCVGHDHIIEDILIPRQRVSFASVHIEPQNLLEIAPIIRKNQLTILGWSHSHANFSVFFSGTDDHNQNVLLTETSNYRILNQMKVKYVYGMTVNVMRDMFGMITTQYSCNRIEHTRAKIQIVNSLPDKQQLSEIREEIHDEILAKVETSQDHPKKHHIVFEPLHDVVDKSNDQNETNISKTEIKKEEPVLPKQNPLIPEFLQDYQPENFYKETLLSDFLHFLEKKQIIKEK